MIYCCQIFPFGHYKLVQTGYLSLWHALSFLVLITPCFLVLQDALGQHSIFPTQTLLFSTHQLLKSCHPVSLYRMAKLLDQEKSTFLLDASGSLPWKVLCGLFCGKFILPYSSFLHNQNQKSNSRNSHLSPLHLNGVLYNIISGSTCVTPTSPKSNPFLPPGPLTDAPVINHPN